MVFGAVRSVTGGARATTVLLLNTGTASTQRVVTPLTSCTMMSKRWESSLPALETKQLTPNIQLKTLQEPAPQPRPLVLLFGWMLAKQRHMDKYGNLYHSKGFDVLGLKMRPGQVLIPQRAQATVEELLNLLLTPELKSRPLMVHGFSVGGYMYGEYLVKLEQNPLLYAEVSERMVGQIFDSPVDFEGVPSGFAQVLTKNATGRKVIQSSLESYLKLMEKPVTSHYYRASKAFHDNNMKLPSLMLFSRTDPIGVDRTIEKVIRKWKLSGVPVMHKCWESSPHVSHFHRHPDEYVEAVLKFLDSIGLSRGSQGVSDRQMDGVRPGKEMQQAQ